MFNHILELLAICLVLAVVLATFLKYLLIILEKLAAIGHALKNLWNSAKQRRACLLYTSPSPRDA